MTQREIQDALMKLCDEQPADFAIRQMNPNQEEYRIEANRNGIIVYCNFLLDAIDKERLAKGDTLEIPDSFWDDSDISLSVKIQEGKKDQSQRQESTITQVGCFLALAVAVIVFIVGVVTSISWLSGL